MHNSYVQSGTLMEASHIPVYCESNAASTQPVTTSTSSLLTGLRQHCTDAADSIPVVVCSASLAGSWDQDDDCFDSIEISPHVDVDKFVVDRLLATAQTVVDCGAAVLACQKVNTVFALFWAHLEQFLISTLLW